MRCTCAAARGSTGAASCAAAVLHCLQGNVHKRHKELLVEVDVDVVLVGVVLEDVDEDKEVLEEVEELVDASTRGCGGA
eukprot:1756473-Amphidinium_carterae.1